MSVTFNQTTTINADGSNPVSGQVMDVGSNNLSSNVSIPAASTGFATNIAFNGVNLQSLILTSNQNITLLINSTGSPFATINLLANVPFVWSKSAGYFANPLNTNVTNIYVNSTSAALLKTKILTL